MDGIKAAGRLLAFVAASVLAGCATSGGFQAYAPDPSAPVDNIAVLSPMNPPSYTLLNQGSAAKGFGGVFGALAERSSDEANQTRLDALLREAGFDFSTAFVQAVTSQLESSGYGVSVVNVGREEPSAEADDDVRTNVAGVDAVLDVMTQAVGYANESITDQDFRPDIRVHVVLLDNRTAEKLYSETFMYGYSNPFMSATNIDAPKAAYYDGADALFEDPDGVKAALSSGVDAVASRLAARLNGG